MDKLAVRHDDGPARKGRDVDGPTLRSFARLESNGRPCHTEEIRVATVATGSLSAGGKRWRRGRHEGWWYAVAPPRARQRQHWCNKSPRRVGQVGIVESSAHRTVPLARIRALSRQTSTFQTPFKKSLR